MEGMEGVGLREWREARGVNQASMARALGVSQPALSNWEKGVRPVPHWMGAKLEILTLRRSGKGVALSDDHMVKAVAACEDRLHVVIAALERRVLALEAVADPLSGFE